MPHARTQIVVKLLMVPLSWLLKVDAAFLPPVQNFNSTHKSYRVIGPRINATTVDGVCTGGAPGTGATSGLARHPAELPDIFLVLL